MILDDYNLAGIKREVCFFLTNLGRTIQETAPRMLAALPLLALLALAPWAALAAPVEGEQTPPPVSGRSLSAPDGILPADVLARVELVRANVEILRLFMGKSPPPHALLRVEGAQPREVYSQAQNLQRRANRLAFEQVRVARSEPAPRPQVSRPADVFAVVDQALEAVLLVKADLGIDTAVAEALRPESTTPSEVFSAVVSASSEINNLLQKQTSPSDVFQLLTAAVHVAAAMHVAIPNGPDLPLEPPFEPNKMPADVYLRVQDCLGLVRKVSASRGMEMLEFEVDGQSAARVTPNDVDDLAALVLEELESLHARFQDAEDPARAYYPGKRFPAHVYQRAGFLEKILSDLAAARPGATGGSPVGS